jgi:hypothetical protein
MIDKEKIKDNVEQYSSIKLCEMIVSHRYLGLFEEACVIAMEELARRRAAGDDFQFEKYISDNLETLPKLNFPKVWNLNTLIETLRKK